MNEKRSPRSGDHQNGIKYSGTSARPIERSDALRDDSSYPLRGERFSALGVKWLEADYEPYENRITRPARLFSRALKLFDGTQRGRRNTLGASTLASREITIRAWVSADVH